MTRRRERLRALLRVARWAAALGGIAVVVVAAFLVWVATPVGNQWLRREALSLAAPLIPGGRLEVDDLQTRLWDGVYLGGVSLRAADGREVLGVDRVWVRWRLGALLGGVVRVDDLRVEGLRLDSRLDAAGVRDLSVLFGPPAADDGGGGPWSGLGVDLELPAVDLRDASLRWDVVDGSTVVSDIGLRGGVSFRGSSIALRKLAVQGQVRAPVDVPVALLADVDLRGGDLVLGELRVRSGATELRVAGLVQQVELRPVLRLRVAADPIEPAEFQWLLGEWTPVGPIDGVIRLEGPTSALLIGADIGTPAGALHTDALLDLDATPATWLVDAETPGLDLSALLPALGPGYALDLRAHIEGAGFDWPAGLAARVQIDGGKQVLAGEPVDLLALDAEVRDGQIVVHDVNALLAVGEVKASGAVDPVAGTLQLAAAARLPDLGALERYGAAGLAGLANWNGALAVDWSDPLAIKVSAQGPVDAVGARSGDIRFARVRGPIDVQANGADVDVRADIRGEGMVGPGVAAAQVHARLQLRVRAGGLTGDADVRALGITAEDAGLEVASLSAATAFESDSAGRLTVELGGDVGAVLFSADGPLAMVEDVDGGEVRLTLRDDEVNVDVQLRRAQAVALDVVARGGLESGEWFVPDLLVSPTSAVLVATAEPLRFRIAGQGLADVAAVIDLVELRDSGPTGRGRLSIDGNIELEAPDFRLTAEDLSVALIAHLAALGGGADASVSVAEYAGRLDLDASIRPSSDGGVIAAQLAATGLYVPGAASGLNVELSVAGPRRRPVIDLELSDADGRFAAVQAEAPLTDRGLDCAGAVQARAVLLPSELTRLALAFDQAPAYGRASADLLVTGRLCDPDLDLVAAAGLPIGADGDEVRLDLRAQRVGDQLTVDGTVSEGLARRGQIAGTARTRLSELLAHWTQGVAGPPTDDVSSWVSALELDIVPLAVPAALVARYGGVPLDIDGRVAGGLHVSGDVLRPSLTGALLWVDGRIAEVPVSMGFLGITPDEQGGFRLDANLGFAPTGSLVIGANLPHPSELVDVGTIAEMPLNLTVSGDGLPLEVLAGVDPSLSDLRGLLMVGGSVLGTPSNPRLDLSVTLQDGGVTIVQNGVRYDDIDLDLRVDGDSILLRELTVRNSRLWARGGREGSLRVTGSTRLSEFSVADTMNSVTMDQFWIIASRDSVIALSGDVELSGGWPQLVVRGDVDLVEGSFVLEDSFFLADQDLTLDRRVAVRREGADDNGARRLAAPAAFWEHFDIDVNLALNRKLQLEAEVPMTATYGGTLAALSSVGLDADLDGELRVVQVPDTPLTLIGEVRPLRGTTTLLGKDFALREGTISFVGGPVENPLLDVNATLSAGAYGTVDVNIGGDVETLMPTFHSDEYPDSTDVVSLLLFGKPTSATDGGEGMANAQLLSVATSYFAGQVERAVGANLLDQFDFDPASGSARVGKALSESLFLSYERRGTAAADENENVVTLEWLVARRVAMEFVTGDRGVSTASLYWRYRF